jgi:hypothetical protein
LRLQIWGDDLYAKISNYGPFLWQYESRVLYFEIQF